MAEKLRLPPEQQGSESIEKMETNFESVRERLKDEHLLVDDGYDYTSEKPPKILPTLFHGTSAWLEPDIKEHGLDNNLESVDDIMDLFSIHPDLERLAMMAFFVLKNHKTAQDTRKLNDANKIYATYGYHVAQQFTKGSELLVQWVVIMKKEYPSLDNKGTFESFISRIKSEIQPIDSHKKRLLMSVLQPDGLIVHFRANANELENFGYHPAEYLKGRKGRKELLDKIIWARKLYLRHAKGDTVNLKESSEMWPYIQNAVFVVEKKGFTDFERVPLSDIVQLYLRAHTHSEERFDKISPKSITKMEKVSAIVIQ